MYRIIIVFYHWIVKPVHFAKYNECEFIGVKLAFPKNNR